MVIFGVRSKTTKITYYLDRKFKTPEEAWESIHEVSKDLYEVVKVETTVMKRKVVETIVWE